MLMKYKDFKLMDETAMKNINGGTTPGCTPGGSIVGSNYYNGVCRVDIRICNAACACNDFCNIAEAEPSFCGQ
jgi:hypothetical protein